MKIKGITIYSVFVLLIFTGTLIFFGNNILSEYKSGEERASRLFSHIANTIEQEPSSYKQTKLFEEKDGVISLLVIKNNTEDFAFPSSKISEQSQTSRFVKVFNKTIVNEETITEIKCAIFLLRPETIFVNVKKAFLIIMLATIFTIAVLIYISLQGIKEEQTEYNEDDFSDSQTDFSKEDEEPSVQNDAHDFTEQEAQEEETSTQKENEKTFTTDDELSAQTEQPNFSTSTPQSENTNLTQQSALEENSAPEEATIENAKIFEETTISEKEEQEESPYYNEALTLKKNELTIEEKLNTSLAKAASNEQDLALFLIQTENLVSAEDSEKILSTLKGKFGNENALLYEENTFACIKADTNIDEAEDFAAEIQKEMISLGQKTFIGISSRSIRMLSAERLIMEAKEAVKHALEDEDSPIIGFHVDIEKYREFIRNS